MPLYEHACVDRGCPLHGVPVEHYFRSMDSLNPRCEACQGATERLMSLSNVVFTGPITARYNDRGKERAHQEGHWAYEKDPITKKQRAVRIETFDDQRAFCKRNNLANPKEMPRNFEIGGDGKAVLNTRGMPGTEI